MMSPHPKQELRENVLWRALTDSNPNFLRSVFLLVVVALVREGQFES